MDIAELERSLEEKEEIKLTVAESSSSNYDINQKEYKIVTGLHRVVFDKNIYLISQKTVRDYSSSNPKVGNSWKPFCPLFRSHNKNHCGCDS